jgi:hypothetical protein
MRAKKTIIVWLLVCGIVGVFTASALAADAWYTCTISRVGGYTAENGSIFVNLTDTKGAFNNKSFKIPDNNRLNQVLAVLLTAAANGSTVYVKADPDTQALKVVYYNVD